MGGFEELYKGVNVVSIICSFLVLITIATIMSIDKDLGDRLSLRFTLAISSLDCLRATLIIFILHKKAQDDWCTFLSFSTLWLTLMYLFLTVAIALNLQLVILRGLRFQPVWELYYWVASLSISTLILFFPLVFGKLGLNRFSNYCEFKEAEPVETFIWRMLTYLLWVILSCAYCTIIVIKVVLKLQQKVTFLNQDDGNIRLPIGAVECANLMRSLKQLIRRITLYCLIPIISQIGFVILTVYRLISKNVPEPLQVFAMVGLASPGVLNFIAFMLDPALYVAVTSLKRHRIVYSETPHNPSPTKASLDEKSMDSLLEVSEPPSLTASPSISEIDVVIFSPATTLIPNRENTPRFSSRHIASMPPPPRSTTMTTRIMNTMARTQRFSLALNRIDENPLYSRLDNRLSTFVQGL